MTQIKNEPQAEGQQEAVSVETAKVIQGMSLVFAGAVTMLEALHPHVSLAPNAILDLVTGNVAGLEEAAAARRAMKVGKEEANATEGTEGTMDSAHGVSVVAAGAGPVDDGTVGEHAESVETSSAEKEKETIKPNPEPPADKTTQPAQPTQTTQAPSITVDDVAKIVVQKVKANPGINDKIRALVNAHGAQRVTELKPEVLEAFLTDLSQL